jgi:hypothetical protein
MELRFKITNKLFLSTVSTLAQLKCEMDPVFAAEFTEMQHFGPERINFDFNESEGAFEVVFTYSPIIH